METRIISKHNNKVRDISIANCCFNINRQIKACWIITNKCNLKCLHCAQLNSSIMKKYDKIGTEKDILLVLDNLKKRNVEHIILSGGEPTLSKFLNKIILLLYNNCFSYSLSTNALTIDKDLFLYLKDHGLNKISISLDGPIYAHEYLRGIGTFHNTINNIRFLGEQKFNLTINCVIHYEMLKQITYFFEILKDLNIYEINFVNPICKLINYSSNNIKIKSEEIKEKLLQIYTKDYNFKLTLRNPVCDDEDCPSRKNIIGVLGKSIINKCVFK